MEEIRLQKIDWMRELTQNVLTVKDVSERTLSLVWFVQDIPRVIRMVSADAWAVALKPFELFLTAIKEIGAFFDVADKVPPVLSGRFREEKNGFKQVSMVTCAVFTAIDGLLLVPQKWNLIDLGKWANRLGGWTGRMPSTLALVRALSLIKDTFILLSIGTGLLATRDEMREVEKKMVRAKRRIASNSPLLQMQTLLEKRESLTVQEFEKIEQLKREYKGGRVNERKRQENQEKMARIAVREGNSSAAPLLALRQVVQYKIDKSSVILANGQRKKEVAKIECWFNISIIAAIVLGNMIQFGAAIWIAPYLGFSVLTLGSILFLANWAVNLATGILGFGKIAATIRYKQPLALPEIHLALELK